MALLLFTFVEIQAGHAGWCTGFAWRRLPRVCARLWHRAGAGDFRFRATWMTTTACFVMPPDCCSQFRPMTVDLASAPSFRLEGKRALITGGGRGIGLTAASALANAGAHVTLAARTEAEIEAAAEAIRARGEQAETLVLDVTDLEAMQAAVAAAEPFNILLNNAGTNRPKMLMEVTRRRLRRHHGAQRARGLFRGAGGGAAAA